MWLVHRVAVSCVIGYTHHLRFKTKLNSKPRFMLSCCRKFFFFFCSQWFSNEVHRRISMPNLFTGFRHTCLSHCLLAVPDFSQICPENLQNLLKFVWRETGNKQLVNFNRANTIIADIPENDSNSNTIMLSFLRGTCIDVVLFTVLRGNITWIIKHLGSTWEGLGWWVTLTPSELKIYQVIRHQNEQFSQLASGVFLVLL